MNNRLNINKTLATVIGLNLIQIAVLLGFILYSFVLDFRSGTGTWFNAGSLLFILVVLTTLINSFYIIRDARYLVQYDSQYHMLTSTLSQVEELNKTLRAQRHDFMNHFQVVHGLIEMDEYQEARNYIERIYSDILKVSRSLKTSNPAINALLQAKMLNCEKNQITVILHVASQLNDLKIPAWEMCRVLGNLIDNAIHALSECTTNKMLNIGILENKDAHIFIIEDNGPKIPEQYMNRIFDPGFTTKGAKGEGMGLAIAREITQSYGGTIHVESDEEKTVFTVKIPKLHVQS